MASLTGKTALVTGGSRGIGAGIARRLAADGAKVAITYTKSVEAASSMVDDIKRSGGEAMAIKADATDAKAVAAALDTVISAYGKLDILVNNAGTAIPKPFEAATIEELDQVIDLNLRGMFIATHFAMQRIQDGGRIIMIGSCVGERDMTPGLAAYAATKGAVKMLTQGLSRELGGRGVTVNNVQPGPIETDLNPAEGDWAEPQIALTALKRYGQVEDVAALVAFVAGPGGELYHGNKPDRRRRHERVSSGPFRS